jgi:hypothetical protein
VLVSIFGGNWREDGSLGFLVDISKKQVAWYPTGYNMITTYERSRYFCLIWWETKPFFFSSRFCCYLTGTRTILTYVSC